MISLDTTEARVIGALLEKESTTPDQYPLSLNGLTTACNQKSNREPVMALSESEVLDALERLKDRNLVAEVVFGSRVAKYKHRFCNNEFSVLKLTKREAGIICVLLLRGPQTPGELRSRTARLCEFSDVGEVEQALEALLQRESGPLVERLAREPGRRESRYRQLFTPADVAAPAHVESVATAEVVTSDVKLSQEQRIVALESELATLRADFDAIKAQWDAFNA